MALPSDDLVTAIDGATEAIRAVPEESFAWRPGEAEFSPNRTRNGPEVSRRAPVLRIETDRAPSAAVFGGLITGSTEPMRVAIVADTHGNLVSLDAVLGEIERDGIEQVVCLGPRPREVVMNPGSVGLPYEAAPSQDGRNPPWAEYAVVTHERGTLGIDTRRVPADQSAIRRAILQSGMPHADLWAADWR